MALAKAKKHEIVDKVAQDLLDSKMTVIAKYTGTSVKSMQQLRREARDNSASVKVIKNRLVVKALKSNDIFKDTDTSVLNGMLLYAFSPNDEVAGAQTIAKFARTQPTVEIVGAFTNTGEFINADDAKAIAALPSKDQLRGQLVGMLNAPLSGFVGVLSGNIRGVLNVLTAHGEQLG